MAIQDFTAGQVLTAAQMDSLQANDYNQTVSTKTASYTLVAADVGTRIVMNSASATTITVNTNLFSAGDTLYLQNIGGGVSTVTAGTATVSSAGPLAIPQNGSGTLYFTSAGVSIYYPSAVTATASGLTLIKTQTIGTTVSSVEVTGAFSSTYDTYLITVSGGAGSTQTDLKMTLGATTSDYAMSAIYSAFTNTVLVAGSSAQASWLYAGTVNTTSLFMNTMLQNPFLTEQTFIESFFTGSTIGGISGGFLNNTTSYTAFTIAPVTGTITGGTIRVYGYANS